MTKQEVLKTLEAKKIVAVVRVDDPVQIYPTVDALLAGGVSIIELTMTIPGLVDALPVVKEKYGDIITLGVGSVLNRKMAEDVIATGVDFVVSPIMKTEIIDAANEAGVLVAVGAFSPTEIQTAWEAGSDVVKVFPSNVLGPSYIKGVRAPMPHLKLMPTGGVDVSNVDQWLAAGCVSLGVGSAMVDSKAIKTGNFEVLTEKAKAFTGAVDAYLNK